MMRRFRRSFARRPKRSVSWIPGFSGASLTAPSQARNFSMTALSTAPNVTAAATILVNDADLSMHGGEDAVITRIRGTLWLYGAVWDGAAPAGTWARVIVALTDVDPSGNVFPAEYMSAQGLGRDEIMWCQDAFVSNTSLPGNGTGANTETGTLPMACRVDVDIKARRRLQSDQVPVLWFQCVKSGASGVTTLTVAGSLRMLLRRPR